MVAFSTGSKPSAISVSLGPRKALVNDFSGTMKPPRFPFAAVGVAGTLVFGAGDDGFLVPVPNIREKTFWDLAGSEDVVSSDSS